MASLSDPRLDALQAQVSMMTQMMMLQMQQQSQLVPAVVPAPAPAPVPAPAPAPIPVASRSPPKKKLKRNEGSDSPPARVPPPTSQSGLLRAAANKPNNDWGTPSYAFDGFLQYLKPFSSVWEPCKGAGHISDFLAQQGFSVHATDINDGDQFDFYKYCPSPEVFRPDIIVTNPPFTQKTRTVQRLFELGLPFAALFPVMLLDSGPVRELLRQHSDWGVYLPNRTINYISLGEPMLRKSRSFFHSAFFTWKVPGINGLVIQPSATTLAAEAALAAGHAAVTAAVDGAVAAEAKADAEAEGLLTSPESAALQ